MLHTITPETSLSGQLVGLGLGIGDSLTLLQGAHVAGSSTGLSLSDSTQALILGQVSGAHFGIFALGATEILLGTSGVIAGNVVARGPSITLTLLGQVYGDIILIAETLAFDASGTITGSVSLTATGEKAVILNAGRIIGDLTVTGPDIHLGLEGSDLAGVQVQAQGITLTGRDIHAANAVRLATTSDLFHSDHITVQDVGGSRFDGGLVVNAAERSDVDLTGGVDAAFLTLRGGSTHVVLEGVHLGWLRVNTDYSTIDARGSTIASSVRLLTGDSTYLGNDAGQWVTDDSGTDRITLGAGQDTLVITRRDHGALDHYDGGGGTDFLNYRNLTANLRIDMGIGIATSRDPQRPSVIGVDHFTGFESVETGQGDDILLGSTASDVLNGSYGNDRLLGGDGNDTLIGSYGADTLIGGPGADEFRFHSFFAPLNGTDLIRDFQQGTDLIDLSFMDGDLTLTGNQQFQFAGLLPDPVPPSQILMGQVSYAHLGGQTIITVFVPSTPVQVGTITLPVLLNLTATDFLL